MTKITESITADVPIEYADKEWTEFMFTSLYKGYANSPVNPAQAGTKIDADACTVTFADVSDAAVNVSVTVECQVTTEADRVREDLRRDLQEYREFLLRRCAQEECRPD